MTSRERLLAALRRQVPDRVPVSPDVSNMMPARYTGKQFWDVYVNEDPPMWKAQLSLHERFGWDMILAVGLADGPDDPPSETRVVAKSDEQWETEQVVHTRKGDLTVRTLYPRSKSPWIVKPLMTNPEAEVDALVATLTDPWTKDASHVDEMREAVGENGILSAGMSVPLAWWLYSRCQLDKSVLDFFDHRRLVEKAMDAYTEWGLEFLRATCERVRPDLFMFAGSVSSMSVISPDLFRRYAFPFLCRANEIARGYGVATGMHMCGRSLAALSMLVDSAIDLLEPLESPPGGDVSLAEVKQQYGDRVCLKGNVNTFKTLARDRVEDVTAEAEKCMDDAAAGGGFILSTGDQVAGDTPEENFVALIEAPKHYAARAE